MICKIYFLRYLRHLLKYQVLFRSKQFYDLCPLMHFDNYCIEELFCLSEPFRLFYFLQSTWSEVSGLIMCSLTPIIIISLTIDSRLHSFNGAVGINNKPFVYSIFQVKVLDKSFIYLVYILSQRIYFL